LQNGFGWECLSGQGEWSFESEALLMFQVKPGRPRKFMRLEGGLPDPNQQTFLDLAGEGFVQIYVNGVLHGSAEMHGDTAAVPDINLEASWNSVLLRFVPAGSGRLRLLWRDVHHRAETTFAFC